MESRYGEKGATVLIHSQVNWDLNGNLKQRIDNKLPTAVTEEFFYDALNRFDYSTRKLGAGSPAINADVTLDAIGNISWKLGVGNYAYHATRKRAVVSAGSNTYGYDANGNMTSRTGANIGYTSYNLPTVINAPGNYSSTISYGAFRNRFKQVAVGPQGSETTIYVAGLLEKVTNAQGTHYRHYIQGGNGTAAIHSRTVGGSNATFYLHRDHLGSPELITDASGNVLVRPSFAAYGERRDGADWDGPIGSGDLNTLAGITRRGFTGHEHLDAVNLIHMNGRVYEPIAGRFLSRDPFIDGVASSQGPNGYAYVHNSPLTFVDPSGFNCEPSPGMSDEEASDYISRCSAEFESGGYGILGQNERWCAAMDLGCQQGILQQRIAEQFYTRTVFNNMLVGRQTFPGHEIIVTATRLGEETMSWAQSRLARDPFADTIVSARLPDGTVGFMLARSNPAGSPLSMFNPASFSSSERGGTLLRHDSTHATLGQVVADKAAVGAISVGAAGVYIGSAWLYSAALPYAHGVVGALTLAEATFAGGIIGLQLGLVAGAVVGATAGVIYYYGFYEPSGP